MRMDAGEKKSKKVLIRIDPLSVAQVCLAVVAMWVLLSFLARPRFVRPAKLAPEVFYGEGLLFDTRVTRPIRDIALCDRAAVHFNEDGTYSICMVSSGGVADVWAFLHSRAASEAGAEE